VLETPGLTAQVQALPATVLGKLIEHVGLEDAGELVALATTEQLAGIFDEDLWRSNRVGEDERFDSERFLLWLEVLLEGGDRCVADRLAELPPDLLTLAFHRHLLVLALDDLQAELTAGDDEAEAAEKAFESCLSEELEDFQLIWRGGDGWDSVLAAILAFDRDHHTACAELLERCAALSREHIDENGGLYAVLSSEEMLEADLGGEREARRAEQGFVAPSSAAAFLRTARGRLGADTPYTEHDPTTRAYFRELSRAQRVPAARTAAESGSGGTLERLLQGAGIAQPAAAPLLLGGRHGTSQEPLLIRAMRELSESAPELFAERSEELAYLSNVLLNGCVADGQRLRPLAAVEHAVESVSAGLALACGSAPPTPEHAAATLARYPADGLFRLALQHLRSNADCGLEAGQRLEPEMRARLESLLKSIKV
jgi:hypothetical protein